MATHWLSTPPLIASGLTNRAILCPHKCTGASKVTTNSGVSANEKAIFNALIKGAVDNKA